MHRVPNTPKSSSMFNIFRRSISSAPSEQSQGHSSKIRSLWPKSSSKSPSTTTPTQSTSSLPSLVSSTVDSRDKNALESSIATPSGHHTLASLPEARTPASSLVQDQPKSSAQQVTLTTTSLDQSHRPASNPLECHQTAPKPVSSIKDILQVTGRSITTIAKRLPAISDPNPVKIALGLVKLIIEIQQAVADNIDTVKRRLDSTRAQLEMVEKELGGWKPKTAQERQCINPFILTLKEALNNLEKLSNGWLARKIADHEAEKGRIMEIFERINEARVQFELAISIRVFKGVYDMEKGFRTLLFERLKPSSIADHKYHLETDEEQLVQREVCTPGTRVRILDNIITWAKNTSPGSPNVYWLFGQAGSGKSTIAYSIARRFEFAGDPNDTIILGGNFFCSRQFEETKLPKCIIRTVVHHLALKCEAFAKQLSHADFELVNQNVRAQLNDLLIAPWQASKDDWCSDPLNPPPHYLIVIDALDEINGTGGSEFLRVLLEVVNENDNRLQGIKFFITSRRDPNLVTHVNSLKSKQLYHLQEVHPKEAQDDIRTYLTGELPHFAGCEEFDNLVTLTGGLFIYAATVVKYLAKYEPSEQKSVLTTLLASSNTSDLQSMATREPFTLLDTLYSQILNGAFRGFNPKDNEWEVRRNILHTFLCTADRTSTSVVADLLFISDDVAEKLLSNLHAVLYCEHGRVLTYHKSFSDFILDQGRSGNFWCNQAKLHRVLADACFRWMKDGLRFNIANIPSSFLLDVDDPMLEDAVKKNIPPVLNYSCRNWSYHISAATSIISGLHDNISDFLRLHALFWIEAMNLLRLRGLCGSILQTARDWVISSQGSLLLAEELAEARSFALYFSGSSASSSTPHLYISALATWPRNLDPCRCWKSHFPRIPGFINASLGGTLLMTLNIHSPVNAVTVSPDGKHIVSGSDDKLVRVWDASTGDELKVLKGHTDFVTSVAFSPDGKQIVSGSNDRSVRVWDVSTGDKLMVLKGHTSFVTSVAFSPDGEQIVSGSADQSLRVWDPSTGDELKVLKGHTDSVTSVTFSPDGKQIVSGSNDESVWVWDVSTGNKKVLKGHTDFVTSVAFSPDGKQIVSGSNDESVWVWDAPMGDELNMLKGRTDWIPSVAFSPDVKQIVFGSSDNSTRVWDAFPYNNLNVLMGHTNWVRSVAFSPDGKQIASGSNDESVRVWDASTGDKLKVLKGHTSFVTSVAFSPDGKQIVSGSYDKSVRVWDASTGSDESNMSKGHTNVLTSVAFSPDGKQIVSGSNDKSVQVWDVATGDELKVLKDHTDLVSSVAFSPDGKQIVSGSYDKSVRVWDVSTGDDLNVLKGHTTWVTSVAFSPDGKQIVSGSNDESVRVWDAPTGDELNVLKGHTNVVTSVAFSPDGKQIVSGSNDKSVRVWDASTGDKLKALKGHRDFVTSVAFSPDGKYIVSGSYDKSVRVWDASMGNKLKVMKGHTRPVRSVAFSPDGEQIVSGSYDKSVRVWDASTGDELNVLKGHTNRVASVAFSPDGTLIVSGSNDSSVRVWGFGSLYIRETIFNAYYHQKHTGWLLSPDGQHRLMFVPPELLLPDSSNILTIPRSSCSSVDFAHSALGPQWNQCYRP